MRLIRLSVIFLLFLAQAAGADEQVIYINAPAGMERLFSEIKVHTAKAKEGNHGLIEYCYKVESYVVYSENVLGQGYELSTDAPVDIECSIPKFDIIAKNKLGLFIGMPKDKVESLVGVSGLPDREDIIWQSEFKHNGALFDRQTYAQFKFKNGVLVWLSVFTTETN